MLTPAEHQQSIMRAGEQVLHSPAQELNRATHSLDRERQQLADLIGAARTKPQQLRALAVSAGIALAVGLVLSPILAGSLPFGLNTRIAALVMRQDRWNAGGALMQAQSPDGWRALLAADLLVRVNQEALAACRAAAAKGGLGRRCTIEVAAE